MTLKYLTVVRIVPPARVAICIVLVFFGRGGGGERDTRVCNHVLKERTVYRLCIHAIHVACTAAC